MRGELMAYGYLKRQGYRIVAHRYRSRSGEIDLIGWDGDILAFIEVKYRRNCRYGRPEEAVGRSKQRQIYRAAADYRRGPAPAAFGLALRHRRHSRELAGPGGVPHQGCLQRAGAGRLVVAVGQTRNGAMGQESAL